MSDVTETDCGNIEESNHPYDVMTTQQLILAADDAVSDDPCWPSVQPCWHKRLIRELVWRVKNEDNRDPIKTAYYRFPEEGGKQ